MHKVGIVVDSTCDMTPAELAELDVRMVPLRVTFGDETFLDEIEISKEEFYERLFASDELPKTSQPAPTQYIDTYKKLAQEGCDEIISLSLSSAISGAYQTSVLASREVDIPVYCFDTKNVTQGLGTLVIAATRLRAKGLYGQELVDAMQHVCDEAELYFIIDDMSYLVKGGRAGRAAGLAASILDIKPILTLDETGTIAPYRKCKGTKKAVAELAKHVARVSLEKGPLNYSLIYTTKPEDIPMLQVAFDAAGVQGTCIYTGSNGPVIGTYVPLACGVAFYPQHLDL